VPTFRFTISANWSPMLVICYLGLLSCYQLLVIQRLLPAKCYSCLLSAIVIQCLLFAACFPECDPCQLISCAGYLLPVI
jgi:hypothetical protein